MATVIKRPPRDTTDGMIKSALENPECPIERLRLVIQLFAEIDTDELTDEQLRQIAAIARSLKTEDSTMPWQVAAQNAYSQAMQKEE